MIDIKYELIAQTKKHRWSIRQVGKFHWVWYILIFHGHNQYKSFSKLLFHLASISLKNRNIWKIHTKSFEILCKKFFLLSFLVILSLLPTAFVVRIFQNQPLRYINGIYLNCIWHILFKLNTDPVLMMLANIPKFT